MNNENLTLNSTAIISKERKQNLSLDCAEYSFLLKNSKIKHKTNQQFDSTSPYLELEGILLAPTLNVNLN